MNSTPSDSRALAALAEDALEELKAFDIRVIDVSGLTSVTDFMVVASGTSSRQVRAIADNVQLRAKEHGKPAMGVEGADQGEWVLVDLCDVVVHVMLPDVRAFYQLEKLWEHPERRPSPRQSAT